MTLKLLNDVTTDTLQFTTKKKSEFLGLRGAVRDKIMKSDTLANIALVFLA